MLLTNQPLAEALQAMSAMLNKHGHGELFFGVKDDGEVVGQDISDATLRQATSWISDKIEPAVFPTVERLDADGGLRYIRVAFSGADAPYSADGRYFTRVGTSNKALSASELSTMVIKRERARNPWDSLPSGRPISDVDEQAVRDLFRAGVIEQYGTGIPRIKETCEAAGVTFRFEQAVNSTIVIFERPGSQVAVTESKPAIETNSANAASTADWNALLEELGNSERRAMELAAANGTVSTKELAEGAQISKRTSSATLKRLAERGLLEWIGKSVQDPKQFYRLPDKG